MKLPHAEAAQVAKAKIADYLLNPAHPDGASKAAFFAALGFRVDDWMVLADALKELASRCEISKETQSVHGTKFVVDGELATPSGKMPRVRTVWIVEADEVMPRLVTAYPQNVGD